MQLGFILSLLFAIVIALFAVLNSEVVTIRLVFGQFQMSQSVVILVSAAIGAAVVFCLGLVNRLKQLVKMRELKNQIKVLETTLSEMESKTSPSSKICDPPANPEPSTTSDQSVNSSPLE